MKKSALLVTGLLPWLGFMGCDPGSGSAVADASTEGCRTSNDCFEVCDTALGECIEDTDAVCPSGRDEDCSRFDGLPLCVAAHCREAECLSDTVCGIGIGVCKGGRCVDEILECVRDPDPREAAEGTVTYEVKVVDALTHRIPENLVVRVCGPLSDSNCEQGPAVVTTIDEPNSTINMEGLPQGAPIHLQLSADGYLSAEFYSQQTAKGKHMVEETQIVLTSILAAPAIGAGADVPVDLTGGAVLYGRVFDCQGVPAEGVSLSSSDLGRDARVLYIPEGSGSSPFEIAETSRYGIAGIINLTPDTPVTLSLSRGELVISSLDITFKKGWITHVHFYPRVYQ